MQHLFSVGHYNSNGSWTMPARFVDRWSRQMNTDYDDLPEKEKHSDRQEAEKLIAIVHEAMLTNGIAVVKTADLSLSYD